MQSGTIMSAKRIVYHTLDQKSLIITGLVNTVLKLAKPTNCAGYTEPLVNDDIDITIPRTSGNAKNIIKQIKYGPKKNASDPAFLALLLNFSRLKAYSCKVVFLTVFIRFPSRLSARTVFYT